MRGPYPPGAALAQYERCRLVLTACLQEGLTVYREATAGGRNSPCLMWTVGSLRHVSAPLASPVALKPSLEYADRERVVS